MFQEDLLNSCSKRPTRSSAPVQVRSANARRGRIPLSAGGSSSRTTMNGTATIAGCTRPTPRHTATTLPKGLSLKAERTVTQSGGSHEDQQHLAHIVDALRIRLPATAVPLNVGEHPADSYILWKANTPFPKLHAARGGCHHGAPGMDQVFVTL